MSRRITTVSLACIGIIMGAFLVCAAPAHAAIKALEAGKTYSIDLNGGKKERVKYTTQMNGNTNIETFHLYVNGKKVLAKSLSRDGNPAHLRNVKLADVSKEDRYKEIFLGIGGDMSDAWVNVIQYRSAKKVQYYSKISSALPYHWLDIDRMKAPGKGTVYVETDTPYYSSSFGCYRMLAPMRLSGKAMRYMKAKRYTLWYGWNNGLWGKSLYDVYTLKKSMTLYSDAKCTKNKGTLSSGTGFKPSELCVANISTGASRYRRRADCHVYVQAKDGTKGWLSFSKNGSGYLQAPPAWG